MDLSLTRRWLNEKVHVTIPFLFTSSALDSRRVQGEMQCRNGHGSKLGVNTLLKSRSSLECRWELTSWGRICTNLLN